MLEWDWAPHMFNCSWSGRTFISVCRCWLGVVLPVNVMMHSALFCARYSVMMCVYARLGLYVMLVLSSVVLLNCL